ncbi:carbohydrate ABC transporter permease [Paenibacillus sedimenti]|uniref:Carbohydrate ABC transporter permease n=1 Tax=Paenibacillus sedimenti TaxID=2770274 RepID=A0A926KPW8_9BACL|nr:carbohydrate ABC transporter permease [Paenibacillus sedimenti]MBD0381859.1 carbohydrate ABC transporter permease [Paenibacillus sedimenti]
MSELSANIGRNKIRQDRSNRIFNTLAVIIISFFAIACLLPFILMLSGSLSDESLIAVNGYSLFPQGFSFTAYKVVFSTLGSTIGTAYMVTIYVTFLGTLIGLVVTSVSGYILSRPDFKHRDKAAFFIYFTTLFSGGLIPSYIVNVNFLHLNHSLWAIILPGLTSPFYIFLYRNFIKGLPHSLVESARIDGAGDFRVYWQIIIPLCKPVSATIGLFLALSYWNNWFGYSLYLVADEKKWGLQFLLYRMLARVTDAVRDSQIIIDQLPTETMKLATAMLVTGPVLLFYPFAQRYFVAGLTIGGVKG